MGCLYMGCSVTVQDVLYGVLVNGMGCSYTGCGVSILDGVLKNRSGY